MVDMVTNAVVTATMKGMVCLATHRPLGQDCLKRRKGTSVHLKCSTFQQQLKDEQSAMLCSCTALQLQHDSV
jgi:hypothetical protein